MENLWGVTIEDLKIAVNLNYSFAASVDRGWVFNRGDCSVWMIEKGWQTAEIDNHNIYENHKLFNNLRDALRRDW